MFKIRAVFTGKDGSMGFRNGKEYSLWSKIEGNHILIEASTRDRCAYSSLQNFLANWKVIQ